MRHYFYLMFFVLSLVLNVTEISAQTEVLTGVVSSVHDADTFRVDKVSVRLNGIDAPEINQHCFDDDGEPYACGQHARDVLRRMILGKTVRCAVSGQDVYERALATCYRGGINLNQYLVAQGWAVAYRKYDRRYVSMEEFATKNKKGLWQGEFISPDNFRAARRAEAEVQEVKAQGDCVIKGNISSKGERIYHTESSNNYARTRINKARGEQWFCSEAEAIAAGWRKPKR